MLYRAKELLDNLELDRTITSIDIKHGNWGIIRTDKIKGEE